MVVGSKSSRVSTSLENLLRILPLGFELKKETGALNSDDNAALWRLVLALRVNWK